MNIESAMPDLSNKEKSFSSYLKQYMPIINKMSPDEIVGIFENAEKLIKLEKQLLAITDLPKLMAKVQELQKSKEYPENKAFDKGFPSLAEAKNEIKKDIGMDVSEKYIKKTLYDLDQIKQMNNDDKIYKTKLMNFFTNIILKGAGHGVVSKIDDESIIKSITAMVKTSYDDDVHGLAHGLLLTKSDFKTPDKFETFLKDLGFKKTEFVSAVLLDVSKSQATVE